MILIPQIIYFRKYLVPIHSKKKQLGPPGLIAKLGPRKYLGKVYEPHNIIITCIMKKDAAIPMSGQCIARTLIEVEYFDFVGKVKRFSAFRSDTKMTLKTILSSTGETLMIVNLRLEGEEIPIVLIDFIPMTVKSEYKYFCSCVFLDSSGQETSDTMYNFYTFEATRKINLISKKSLIEYKDFYLPNDVLSLRCKIAILTGMKFGKIVKAEYETTSVGNVNPKLCLSQNHLGNLESSVSIQGSLSSFHCDSKSPIPFLNRSSLDSKRNDNLSYPFPNALEDFAAFYKKGILCDIKLQTATETIPAHSVILSARSPVFEAMFTTNMKENIQKCVRIDDVNAETVERMLLFLYSDTLEELVWANAKKLYFAADKYQVLSLKHRCAVILKRSIELNNCCELLILADLHKDEDLKAAAQDYIAKEDKKVFLSDQWRDLEKSHPYLAIDIFRAIQLKNN
ncbi:TD and POZ domain-containing protein 1 [Argiope bruennichi]|uniref:TD and POZ domain-containing protein 1 n=1 Tax=Argiope bruennichi TaxID=94029 RepID=A0A8T0FBU8_ARGBR|nr:TD and POZ domain-containing protein 1 [Argiope bruennichi]